MRSMNVLKSMPPAEPIMMFGGSPTSVPTPPVSDSSAAASRYGTGEIFWAFAIRMMSGPKMTTVVTLSSNSDSTVTAVPSSTSMRKSCPLLSSASL